MQRLQSLIFVRSTIRFCFGNSCRNVFSIERDLNIHPLIGRERRLFSTVAGALFRRKIIFLFVARS